MSTRCFITLSLAILVFIVLFSILPATAQEEGTVTLPLNEYKNLIKPQQREAPRYVPPPVDYYIPRADYTLRCSEYSSTMMVRIDVVILKRGLTQVPLMDLDLPLRSFRLDGATADLMFFGQKYVLNTHGPGKHQVELEIPFDSIMQTRSLSFSSIPATIPTLTVESPMKNMEFRVSPATPMQQSDSGRMISKQYILPHDGTIMVTALPKHKAAKLEQKWNPKVIAELQHVVTVGEAMLSCATTANLQVLNAPVREVRFSVPEGCDILSVEGEHLAEHVRDGATLTLSFDMPLEGEHSYVIKTEKKLKNVYDTTTFFPITLQKAARQKGYIAIAAKTNVEITVPKAKNAALMDLSELPGAMSSSAIYPLILSFKYLTPECSLELVVKRYRDIPVLTAVVNQATIMTFKTEEGISISRAVYQVRNNLKQHMAVALPRNSEIWGAFVSGRAEKPATDDKGHLLIPLEKSSSESGDLSLFPVEIIYITRGGRIGALGMPEFQTPAVDLPVSAMNFQLWFPDTAMILRTSGMRQSDSSSGLLEDFSASLMKPGERRTASQGILNGTKGSSGNNTWLKPPYLKVIPTVSSAGTNKYTYQVCQVPDCYTTYTNGTYHTTITNPDYIRGLIEPGNEQPVVLQTGVFPVRVSIPQQGRSVTFERYMVTSGSPSVRVCYLSRGLSLACIIIISLTFFSGTCLYILRGREREPQWIVEHAHKKPVHPVFNPAGIVLAVLICLTAIMQPIFLLFPAGGTMLGMMTGKIITRLRKRNTRIKAESPVETSPPEHQTPEEPQTAPPREKKYGSGRLAEQGA